MAVLARAGNALFERVSGDPKIRVNQVFPGPLNIGCPRVRAVCQSVKRVVGPKTRTAP